MEANMGKNVRKQRAIGNAYLPCEEFDDSHTTEEFL
jgi:hypothetical protein